MNSRSINIIIPHASVLCGTGWLPGMYPIFLEKVKARYDGTGIEVNITPNFGTKIHLTAEGLDIGELSELFEVFAMLLNEAVTEAHARRDNTLNYIESLPVKCVTHLINPVYGGEAGEGGAGDDPQGPYSASRIDWKTISTK